MTQLYPNTSALRKFCFGQSYHRCYENQNDLFIANYAQQKGMIQSLWNMSEEMNKEQNFLKKLQLTFRLFFLIVFDKLGPQLSQYLFLKRISHYHMDYSNQNYMGFEELYRVQPKDMGSTVHSSIVAITSRNQLNEITIGSGVLISNNLVLTQASIIFNAKLEMKQQLQCYLPGGYSKQDIVELQQCRTQQRNYSGDLPRSHRSYALIKIKNSIRNKSEWPSIIVPCKLCILKYQLQIYGCNWSQQTQLQNQPQTIIQQGRSSKDLVVNYFPQQQTMTFDMKDSQKFQGCPVFNNQQIIGINIGSMKRGNKTLGLARLISQDLLQNLDKWSKEMNGGKINFNNCRHTFSGREKMLKAAKQYFNKANFQNFYLKKIEYYEKCLMIQEDVLGDMAIQVALTKVKIGVTYAKEKIYEKSIIFLEESTIIFEYRKVREYNYAVCLWHLATSYFNIKDYEAAVLNFQKRLRVWEQLGNSERIKDSSLWLAKSLRAANQIDMFNQIINLYNLNQTQL